MLSIPHIIVLLSALYLPSVCGISDVVGQTPLNHDSILPLETFSLSVDASISRTAEIAILHLSFSTINDSAAIAKEQATARIRNLETLFKKFSPDVMSGKDECANPRLIVNDFQVSSNSPRKESLESKSSVATAQITAQFCSPDASRDFQKSIASTGNDDIDINWADHKLSAKSEAAARTELRMVALENAQKAGDDFARRVWGKSVRMFEINEQDYFVYNAAFDEHFGPGISSFEDELESTLPEVQMKTSAQAKFVLTD